MLIEVKVKVTRIIDAKKRKKLETYILNKDFFSEAEYKVTEIHYNVMYYNRIHCKVEAKGIASNKLFKTKTELLASLRLILRI